MIVSIHQPMHFPYMGFFQKMEMSDLFILLDDVQFSKNDKYAFYNRNKFMVNISVAHLIISYSNNYISEFSKF